MDKYEQRRLALEAMVKAMGRGAIASIAAKIGKDANYVSRMLYPVGKDGKKRIGEDSWDDLVKAFPQLSPSEPAGQSQSQAVRNQRETMRAAARLMEGAREFIIGTVDEDALIDSALEAAEEIGSERILNGDAVIEGVRLVASKIRAN